MNISADSGFQALLGYRIVEWSEGLAVAELAVGPQHLNRSGFLHGGVLTALIDTVCGYAGCYCAVRGRVRRAMTLSLTTNFTGRVDGGVLKAVGRKQSGGSRIYYSIGEVFDGDGLLVAVGQGTFRYRTGSESETGVPR
jgi:uncharacterized protein (TIGR00369 family)